MVEQSVYIVRSQSDGCFVECDDNINGTSNFGCYSFSDGMTNAFEAAGLKPSSCTSTTFESPDESDKIDPEMVITSCPEWTLWMGWDRGTDRTTGNMRQSLMLKSDDVISAFNNAVSGVKSDGLEKQVSAPSSSMKDIKFTACDGNLDGFVSSVTLDDSTDAGEVALTISGTSDRYINKTFHSTGDDPDNWFGVIPQFFYEVTHTGGTIPRPTFNAELCEDGFSPGFESEGFSCPLNADDDWSLTITFPDLAGARLVNKWTAAANSLNDPANSSETVACIEFDFRVPV